MVMLTVNMHQRLGLVNRTTGIVHQILLSEDQSMANNSTVCPPIPILINFTPFIHTHSNLLNIQLEGLPQNIVPITCISRTMFYKHNSTNYSCEKFFKIVYTQLPLMPTFFLIDYKGQRQTYDCFIIDLKNPPDKHPLSMHNIYVTLSHLHTHEGLIIL